MRSEELRSRSLSDFVTKEQNCTEAPFTILNSKLSPPVKTKFDTASQVKIRFDRCILYRVSSYCSVLVLIILTGPPDEPAAE